MVIASIVGEVRSSTIRVAALPSPKKEFKLTGDSDGKSKGCELEGDHGELWQGVVRLERLVAAGGEGPGKGGEMAAKGRRPRGERVDGGASFLHSFSSLRGFGSHGAIPGDPSLVVSFHARFGKILAAISRLRRHHRRQ